MTVYIHRACTWEADYLQNEILTAYHFIPFDTIESLVDKTDVEIVILNVLTNIESMRRVFEQIRPRIVIYSADEYGSVKITPDAVGLNCIVLRQYNYFVDTNIFQVPLGYVNNYLSGKSSSELVLKNITERNYDISFVGELKSNRSEMLKAFECEPCAYIRTVQNTWDVNNLPISPPDLFGIYSNSKFVLCGRGNFTLDSFRIYEAIAAGAIPIVVGDHEECIRTFWYGGDVPPILFADTWTDALNKYRRLLTSPTELIKQQRGLFAWWKRIHVSLTSLDIWVN
jgi:hypothetical protein